MGPEVVLPDQALETMFRKWSGTLEDNQAALDEMHTDALFASPANQVIPKKKIYICLLSFGVNFRKVSARHHLIVNIILRHELEKI